MGSPRTHHFCVQGTLFEQVIGEANLIESTSRHPYALCRQLGQVLDQRQRAHGICQGMVCTELRLSRSIAGHVILKTLSESWVRIKIE